MRLAKAGDRDAFDALYAEHAGRVYAVCLRMTGDVARASQLTQDAFVKAWQSLDSFREESAFSTWLHRLTVNIVLMDVRSTKRREARVQSEPEPDRLGAATREADTETRIDLERAIAGLPDGARRILVLYDIEGYAQQEIAEMMGIAVGTVKAQLHRARMLLRERWAR